MSRRRLRVPLDRQSDLPEDQTYQPDTPGMSIGHVLDSSRLRARPAHPADNKTDPVSRFFAMLKRIYGKHPQTFTNFATVVPAVSTQIVPYNPQRAYLIIVNTGTVTMFVGFDRDADAFNGVPIVAGGNYEPILGTISSVSLLSSSGSQRAVLIEGFYGTRAAQGEG